jgi:hypothetical protein
MKTFPPAAEALRDYKLSVVECALGWPEGLSTLCRAGYRTGPAFKMAIFRNDSASAEVMTGSDIPITERHLRSVSKICHSSGISDLHNDILEWTIDTPLARRMELMRLALAQLPAHILEELSLDLSRPPESISNHLFGLLQSFNGTVPHWLRPTSLPLFHCFDVSRGAAGRLGRLLVKAGFDEIDSLKGGKTPLDKPFEHLFQPQTPNSPFNLQVPDQQWPVARITEWCG